MYKLTYELRGEHGSDRRKAVVELLPLTCSISHALVEVAQVFTTETYRLHTLTLEELAVHNGEYKVKATIVRYEREGL